MSAVEASATAPKRRTFKKFTYRGVDLDKILDMKREEFLQLLPGRIQRKFSRMGNSDSSKAFLRKVTSFLKKLRKAKQGLQHGEKPEAVKTHLRTMVILPEMIGSVAGVYNGKVFINVEVKPEMLGHYLGEFALTYKPISHGRAGMGSNAQRYIPLK